MTRISFRVALGLAAWLLTATPALAQATSWTAAATGSYLDPARWTNGVPDGPTFDALIAAAGTPYTVTLAGNATVNSLTLNAADATVDHTSGTYTVGTGGMNLLAGTYRLGGGTVSGGAITGAANSLRATAAGGTISGASVAAGVLDLSAVNAQLRLTGGTTLASGTILTFNASNTGAGAQLEYAQTGTLVNSEISLGDRSSLAVSGSGNTLTLDVNSRLQFTGNTAGRTADVRSLGGANTLVNNNLIRNDAFQSTLTIGEPGSGTLTFTNNGLIDASNSSTTVIAAATTFTNFAGGTLTGGSYYLTNATLDLGGRAVSTLDTNVLLSGTGSNFIGLEGQLQTVAAFRTVTVRNRNYTVSNPANGFTLSPTSTLSVDNGTVTIPAGVAFTNFAAGTLTGGEYFLSGTLDLGGRAVATLAAGTRFDLFAGSNVVGLDGQLQTISTGATIQYSRNATLSNPANSFTMDGNLLIVGATVTLPAATTLTNLTAGTLTGGLYRLSDFINLTGSVLDLSGKAVTTLGAGTQVELSTGSNFIGLEGQLRTIAAGATLTVQDRTLTLSNPVNTFAVAGNLNVYAGATVTVPTGVTLTNLTGGTLDGGTYVIEGNFDLGTQAVTTLGAAAGTETTVWLTTPTAQFAALTANLQTIAPLGVLKVSDGFTYTVANPANSFTNNGTIKVRYQSSAGAVVIPDAIAWTNFNAGTLTGGTYDIESGTLDVGTRAVTTLGTGTAVRLVGATAQFVGLEGNLRTVAAGASLEVAGRPLTVTNVANSFTNDGLVTVGADGFDPATFTIPNATAWTNYNAGTVTGGRFVVNDGSTLDIGSRVVTALAGGARVELIGPTATITGGLAGLNNIDGTSRLLFVAQTASVSGSLNNAGTLQVTDGSVVAVGGSLNNPGTTAVTGGSTLTTGGAATNNGTLTVEAGSTLVVNGAFVNTGTLAGAGSVLVATNGVFTGGTYAFTGTAEIAGNLQITGTTTVASGTYTVVGPTTVSAPLTIGAGATFAGAGAIDVPAGQALTVNGAVAAGKPITVAGTLDGSGTAGGPVTTTAGAKLAGSGGGLALTDVLTVAGDSTLTAGTVGVTGGTTVQPGAKLQLKPGTTLGGAGGVTVRPGGTFALSDSTVPAFAPKPVTIQGTSSLAGTLTGNGTVGALVVQPFGRLAPGNSAGTVTVTGDIDLGGLYDWELVGNDNDPTFAGTGFDKVTGGGTGVVSAAAKVGVRLGGAVNFANPFWTQARSWTVLSTAGPLAAPAAPVPVAVSGVDFTTNYPQGGFATLTDGNNLFVTWTPVPEPTSVLAVGLLAAGGIATLRRRT